MFAVTKSRVGLGFCALALIVIGYTAFFTMDGLLGNVLRVFLGDTTVYTPGYSDEKFKTIKTGDTVETVMAVLGKPWMYVVKLESELTKRRRLLLFDESGKHNPVMTVGNEQKVLDLSEFRKLNQIHSEVWQYSKSDRDGSFRERYIVIMQGRVSEKIAAYYAD